MPRLLYKGGVWNGHIARGTKMTAEQIERHEGTGPPSSSGSSSSVEKSTLSNNFVLIREAINRAQVFFKNPFNIVRILVSAFAILILFSFFGTSPVKIWRWMHGTKGYIFVDSPEVYTRERLINERLKEDAWLNEQFKLADSDESVAGIVATIEKSRNSVATTSTYENKSQSKTSQPEVDRDDNNAQGTNVTLNSANKYTSVDALTFNERVTLKSANRDFILQKLIENRLDDRHDLQGNSLYIFKFDTTVITSEFSDQKAMVEVELVPPIAGDVTGDKDSFLISAISDPLSASLLRDAFDQFNSDTLDRLSRSLKRSSNTSKTDTNQSNSVSKEAVLADFREVEKIWIKNLAQEFGLEEAGISLQEQLLSNQEKLAEADQSFRLVLRIDAFLQYFSFETTIKRSDVGKVAPIFSVLELYQPFMLIAKECDGKSDKAFSAPFPIGANQIGKQFVSSDFPAENKPQFEKLAGKLIENSKQEIKLNFYMSRNGYESLEHSKALNFLRLLSSKMEQLPTNFGQASVPWGYVSRTQSLTSKRQSVENCYALTGYLSTGFMAFAQKVANHNSYSYSVLPRQSAVSVVEQILESRQMRLGTSGLSALKVGGSLSSSTDTNVTSSSLRSRISAFGYALQSKGVQSDNVIVGWILDPSASKSYASSDNLNTVTESIMAIVSVPAWWPYVNLNIRKSWLNVDGSTEPDGDLPANATYNLSTEREKDKGKLVNSRTCAIGTTAEGREACQLLRVSLPNSREIIESSIISVDKRFPSISEASCEKRRTEIKTDGANNAPETVTCIIMGKRLWRNTLVTLGVVEHGTIKILPNMEGVVATFAAQSIDCDRPLRVWTSEGVATFGKADVPHDLCGKEQNP